MIELLSGRTHEVVSGLCLRGDGWEDLRRAVTAVSFRPLAAGEVERYVSSGEWEGRAGATRSRAAAPAGGAHRRRLSERGRPAGGVALRLLAERFPGRYTSA